MFEERFIATSNPIIFEDNKPLVNKDEKNYFYKLSKSGIWKKVQNLEEVCHEITPEENNPKIEIFKPINPMIILKNLQITEKMAIVLINYIAKLLNKNQIKSYKETKEVAWLNFNLTKNNNSNVTSTINFQIDKGDLK